MKKSRSQSSCSRHSIIETGDNVIICRSHTSTERKSPPEDRNDESTNYNTKGTRHSDRSSRGSPTPRVKAWWFAMGPGSQDIMWSRRSSIGLILRSLSPQMYPRFLTESRRSKNDILPGIQTNCRSFINSTATEQLHTRKYSNIHIYVYLDFVQRLVAVLRHVGRQQRADEEDLLGLDLDVRRLSLGPSQRLVDHDTRVRQRSTLSLQKRLKQKEDKDISTEKTYSAGKGGRG